MSNEMKNEIAIKIAINHFSPSLNRAGNKEIKSWDCEKGERRGKKAY